MNTITIRCDEEIKVGASQVYEKLGMNLTQAINMFLRQTIIQQKFPCIIESINVQDPASTYPDGFFELFGCGTEEDDFGEIEDLPLTKREDLE